MRKEEGHKEVFGLLNIDKPSGSTSHDVVAFVRKLTGQKRIGHGGTLDPLATGVLVLALGRATRLLEYVSGSDKEYVARIKLGVTTDTYDANGAVVSEYDIPADVENHIDLLLTKFEGLQLQSPPVYSAIKLQGKPAYARVRSGETVSIPPREITIYEIHNEGIDLPYVRLRIRCSAGTYIRSLAHDIGIQLGCGAIVDALCRTASGLFQLKNALEWGRIQKMANANDLSSYLLPMDHALLEFDRVDLDRSEFEAVISGRPVPSRMITSPLSRAYGPDGTFVGIIETDPLERIWRPHKVLWQSN